MDSAAVVYFVNGCAAMALASRYEFVGQEIPRRFRVTLAIFGAVCFFLGFVLSPTAVP